MTEVAARYQEKLPYIKKEVTKARQYFRKNYDRYYQFHKFTFATGLTDEDINVLKATGKPQVEFNINEAYISRLCGEFSKQQPSIEVGLNPNANKPVDIETQKVVEAYIRHEMDSARQEGTVYRIYRDMLAGGFSVGKVFTEHAHPMSFDQVIRFQRVFDPTLAGFDYLSRHPTKKDARYSFDLYPKAKDEFEEEYPDVDIRDVNFSTDLEGFNWTYQIDDLKVLMMCDLYMKKRKRKKIVKLATGAIMTEDNYKKMTEEWFNQGVIQPPPAVVDSRFTEIDTICRYVFIESQVIKYEETSYTSLPHIFFDGNSVILRQGVAGAAEQMTRPYVFHMKGAQKLKNFAGQCLANELENMVQSKWIACKEGIPEEYFDAYVNPQKYAVLIYNAYKPDEPEKQLPPPQPMVRPPIPAEITQAFTLADQVTQNILGSYDASLGINDNQLSGVAVVEAATQSNAAAMPYVVGIMQGLTQVAQSFIELIPKYFVTPRTIPVVGLDNKRSYQKINQEGTPNVMYDDNALNVTVEAGVNFQIQKNKTLMQIQALAQSMPIFAQFMNTVGLPTLLDNLDIRGVDNLKMLAEQWMKQQQEQQQQQAQSQQNQPNPLEMKMQIEAQKVQLNQQDLALKAERQQADIQAEAAKIAIAQQDSDNNRARLMMEAGMANSEHILARERMDTEKQHAATELAIEAAKETRAHHDQHHRHGKELMGLQHTILSSQYQQSNKGNE